MTALLNPPAAMPVWSAMPGWDIVADLTPPELIASRQLRVLRRRIVIALFLVVVLCGAGYYNAVLRHGSASDDLGAVATRTTELQVAGQKYSGITSIETAVSAIRGQVAGVMKDDVDVAHTIAAIRAALPNTMSIASLSLTLTPAVAAGGAGGLDASGRSEIGTVNIGGSGHNLDDLPAFVDHLVAIPGVVNVVPSSNQVSAGTAVFSLTFSLTTQLYSHRYDVTNTGGN